MERFPVGGAFLNGQGIPLLLTAIFTSSILCDISQKRPVIVEGNYWQHLCEQKG
jgi:hypothetical protein